MTFRNLEQNTWPILESKTLYDELQVAQRKNSFTLLSSLNRVSTLRNDTVETSSATVTNTGTEYQLSTTATSNDYAQLSTAERGRYSPGSVGEAGIGIRTTSQPTGDQNVMLAARSVSGTATVSAALKAEEFF